MLVSGGMDSTSTTELFDPSTGQFGAGPSMANPRYGHASVRLADGRVLIIGGTDGNQAMASVEVYDPATGRISTTGSLVTERIVCHRRFCSPMVACWWPAEPWPTMLRSAPSSTTRPPGHSSRPRSRRACTLVSRIACPTVACWSPATSPRCSTRAPRHRWPAVTPRSDGPFIATGDPIEDRVGHSATRLRDGRVLISAAGHPTSGGRARTVSRRRRSTIRRPGPSRRRARCMSRRCRMPTTPSSVNSRSCCGTGGFSCWAIGRTRGGCRSSTRRPARSAYLGSLGPEEVTVGQPIAAVQLVDGRILLFGPSLDRSSTIDPTPWPTSSTSGSHERRRSRTCRDAAASTTQWFLRTVESSAVCLRRAERGPGVRSRHRPVVDPRRSSRERRSMVLLADGRVLFTSGWETTASRSMTP